MNNHNRGGHLLVLLCRPERRSCRKFKCTEIKDQIDATKLQFDTVKGKKKY
jgi:hypothetical protein